MLQEKEKGGSGPYQFKGDEELTFVATALSHSGKLLFTFTV